MALMMQQEKSVEVEVKIRISDPAAVLARLGELGFRPKSERQFESNTIWDTPEQSLRASGEIVRLREYGPLRLLTYKGPAQSGKYKRREELESDLTALEPLERIFTRLGLTPNFRYEKYRTEFERPGASGLVTVDETPIGDFIELEGEPRWIDETAHELGFPESSYLTGSYATLYVNYCNALGIVPQHMIFPKA
jgi:adenylate cyclase, class 2